MTALTANDIVLVPIRSGVGLRLGADVGYLKFTPQSTWNPFWPRQPQSMCGCALNVNPESRHAPSISRSVSWRPPFDHLIDRGDWMPAAVRFRTQSKYFLAERWVTTWRFGDLCLAGLVARRQAHGGAAERSSRWVQELS
jgi:Envelope integrity protein A